MSDLAVASALLLRAIVVGCLLIWKCCHANLYLENVQISLETKQQIKALEQHSGEINLWRVALRLCKRRVFLVLSK